ncbi:MAG TPA: amino acid ABC transporter permease [Ruminococcaceae bacterium]|nr:amino acid ABC transporter permease [Oscillospiraceae bacterium]
MNMNAPVTFMDWVVFLLKKYGTYFLQGCETTLILALIGTLFGCIIGLLVGVLRTIPKPGRDKNIFIKALYKILQFLLLAYIEIFRGTPMMVQAMVLFYGSMQLFNINMTPLFAGFFVVSVNTGAYMAETVRGGIESVDKGQTEAAEAIGMTHWQTMTSVILPQTFRNILPQIGNNLIINIKDTSVLNVISVTELYFNGKSAAGVYYRYFETYFIISVFYFIMTFICARLLRWIEHKIDGSDYYQLADPMNDPSGTLPDKKKTKGVMRAWLR